MQFTGYYISFIYQLRIFLLLNKRNRLFNFIQLFILILITSLILIFEFYYQYVNCAVSKQYSNKNIKLTHKVIDMLDNLSIPYWFDFQSLLNVLRNETFNVWDHDVDLSIQWPLTSNKSHFKLNNWEILMKKINKYGFRVDFYPKRNLLQFKFQDDVSVHKSHVDIWLWTRKYIYHHYGKNYQNKNDVLENVDSTIKYKNRLISQIYPLKLSKWLNRNITIPFDSHTIAYQEYGASYMKAIVFRKNCIYNLFLGRWM